jgi:hypothetical protein
VKFDGPPDACTCIDVQAVDLHHPWIALQLDKLASARQGPGEQAQRGGGFYHDVGVGPRAKHRVDHLDRPRRMTEPVPRDIKDDAI